MNHTEKKTVLYKNAKIFTSDRENLWADAMIVTGGRVKWVGYEKNIKGVSEAASLAETAEIIDLGGRTVLPGFVDAHMHPIMLADYSTMISALPPEVNSIAELTTKIAERSNAMTAEEAARAERGELWIRGWGYDEGKFAEHRAPNRYDLDAGAERAPVLVHRTCAHVICVNSKALELAGITADTPDPEGGQIDRDENGEPTGVLRETAKNLIEPFLPVPSHDELVQQIVDLGKILEKQGVVAVADMGLFDASDTYALLSDAAKAGFAQRAAVYYMWHYFLDNPPVVTEEMKDHDKQIYVAGVKTVGDGSISGRTAWLYEPYLGGGKDDCGICVCSDEVLESAIAFAKKHGIQLSMHAMGGQAIDRIIRRAENEKKWTNGETWPHLRLEHLTEPTEYAIGEAIKKGYAFVTQPIFQYSEIESYLKNMGLERTCRDYPIRTMLERGVNLALSTDAPATSWATPSDPLPNIKAAVTRVAYDGTDYGPIAGIADERLTVEEAIYLYTRAGALILGMNDSGWLHKGALADFLVLSDDIFTVPAERIDRIKIKTIMHDK